MSTLQDKFEADRLEKLRKIEQLGLDPWGGRFDGHQPIAVIKALPAALYDPATAPAVRAAGRIMTARKMGKVRFLDLADLTGRIQIMIGQKQVGDVAWQLAENLDLGDQLGVDGRFATTKTGEPTIFAEHLHYLGKSLLPHPDKWAGIEDVEFALRHRYLDLIYNPDLRDKALARVRIIQWIREYLNERGFLEVETPVLHSTAGGAAARPFITHHNALGIDLYLRIALELHLKRLLVAGFEKVYELGRVFRNEGISPRHNPEFTMLELYQAYGDYRSMMDLTEGMIVNCVDRLGRGRLLEHGETAIDFTPPWQRVRYGDLFAEHVGASMEDEAEVRRRAAESRLPLDLPDPTDPAGEKGRRIPKDPEVLVHELFEHHVERHLKGPVFVYDYPAALCPLTKRRRDNPKIAERFELYIRGMELANAYTELNDPVMQEATFRRQLAGLPEEDSMARMDDDFVKALKYGMPPAGGLGVGIDRLVMLLTNSTTIRDVILFPLLRPETR